MQLDRSFKFKPVPAVEDAVTQPFAEIDDPLGPLAALPGSGKGHGSTTIGPPHHKPQARFPEPTLPQEPREFEEIPGGVELEKAVLDLVMRAPDRVETVTFPRPGERRERPE